MASGGLLERPGAGTGLLRLPGGVPEAPGGTQKIDVGSPGGAQRRKVDRCWLPGGSPGLPQRASGGDFGTIFCSAARRGRRLRKIMGKMGFCLREGAFSSKFSKCLSRRVGRAGVLTNFGKALNSIGFFDTNGLGALSARSQKKAKTITKMHPNADPRRQ